MKDGRSDISNILCLTLLYCLQGIPIGLTGSAPFILQKRKLVGFKGQALFSLSTWPFSLKVFFAPIVDSVCVGLGPRKTWLMISQFGIAVVMFLGHHKIDEALESADHVHWLLAMFSSLCFFASIQDVAVDGWALTMLSKQNLNWASTCNTIGQAIGIFFGNTVFLALNSTEFCVRYLKMTGVEGKNGILPMSRFFRICGPLYILISAMVIIFKHEKHIVDGKSENTAMQRILKTYIAFKQIVTLPAIRTMAFVHLTSRIAFAAADNLVALELIERGLAQHTLALVSFLLQGPLQIFLPLYISRSRSKTTHSSMHLHPLRPFSLFIRAYPVRLLVASAFVLAFLAHDYIHMFTGRDSIAEEAITIESSGLVDPAWNGADGLPFTLLVIVVLLILYRMVECVMFVSLMAFHARISDPLVGGGTYMTLLNALSNCGSQWLSPLCLRVASGLDTIKRCSMRLASDRFRRLCSSSSSMTGVEHRCRMAGGQCLTLVDPFYVTSVVCISFGLVWYLRQRPVMDDLQKRQLSEWTVVRVADDKKDDNGHQ